MTNTLKLWCDDSAKRVLTSKYMDKLEEAQVDIFAVMLNCNFRPIDPLWKRIWDAKDLEKLAKLLSDRQIKFAIEKCPRPSKEQIDLMTDDLLSIVSATQPTEIGDDNEANWNKKFLDGFPSMEEAAEYLHARNDELCQKAGGAKKCLTSFPSHWEYNLKTAIYSKMVDFNDSQVYSVVHRTAKGKDVEIPWTHKTLGPGNMQRHYLKDLAKLGPKVGAALALYDQKWAGHTEEEAVLKAANAAKQFQIDRFCGWSSKWTVGKFGKKWTIETMKKIKNL